MTDNPAPTSGKTLVVVLSLCLIVVAGLAGYILINSQKNVTELQGQVSSLTTQLEDSEKQIAELQPLAQKARTLPITFRIDRHALGAGYTLFTFNRARESLRFTFTVNGNRKFNTVIDGGRLWMLKGLATGDSVEVVSDGYDPKTVAIQ
jgi:hypothetical protein